MMTRRWARAWMVAATLIGGTGPSVAQGEPLAALDAARAAIATDLARQIADCSRRRDTGHAAFRGCVDWHSAVHGVWALIAFQRATGDGRHAALVSSILAPEALDKEREELRRSPRFEMPYGRAWFLRLAIDHRKLTGRDDLAPFADEVAASLREHYRRHAPDRYSGAYASDSWALINLLDYARHRRFGELEAEIAGRVRRYFVEVDPACGHHRERGEFMAVCTNWAALVSRVLERDAYRAWLERFISANGVPMPLVRPATDHEFGLNFSRAWGLWDMYRASDRPDLAAAYAAHVERGLTPATNWRGDYMAVGHWVAQFAMFALQPLFGQDAGR